MRYEIVPARRLSAEHLAAWGDIRDADARFDSPFFDPAYTRAVAAVREGVEVCLLRDGDTVVGVLPFERQQGDVGRPVGGSMSNFQAVITRAGTAWDAVDLVRGARLRAFTFHHQLTWQDELVPFTQRHADSPVIDLAGGWDDYLARRRDAGVSSFNALPRKMRKLERELGPLRFVPHDVSREAFALLVSWKRAQYARTGAKGSLMHDWAAEALRHLFNERSSGFAGMLSTLYAGDRLIAVHAGMRSATAWHYWFPAYDAELAHHSPGLVLMHEMCRWAASAGLARIDLGPGDGAHKDLFATSAVPVAIGRVDAPEKRGLIKRLMARLHHA